jgi:diacylglycerol kinase family enzyme
MKEVKNKLVRIYAVGGDGILFDCLNGMVHCKKAELTNIPYGNDNDFIRVFGENVKEQFRDIRNLIHSPSHEIDILHCGTNYALIETFIGVAAHALLLAKAMFTKIPEKLPRNNVDKAYLISMIRALFNKKVMQQTYHIKMDGEDFSGKYAHIHIANCACNGATFVPSPYVKPNNGFMDVLLTNTTKKLDIIRAMPDHNKGHFEKQDIFIYKRCNTLEINSPNVMRVAYDGEAFHAKELKISVIPKAIKFFAPEGLEIVDYSHLGYSSGEW